MAFQTPHFRSAVMGFNKTEVSDFLARMDSEIEIYESRQAAADKTIGSMKNEIQSLTRRMEILTEDNCRLENANNQLRQQVYDYDDAKVSAEDHQKVLEENRELKERLAQLEEEKATDEREAEIQRLTQENQELSRKAESLARELEALRQENGSLHRENETLRASGNTSQEDLKSIQDALVSAQRMSQIVIGEAREEAQRLTAQAHQEAEALTSQAQQEATHTLEDARQRNEALQACYDRMLMDTSKMKCELIELYRRHLALLAEIPGQGDVPVLEAEALETVGE